MQQPEGSIGIRGSWHFSLTIGGVKSVVSQASELSLFKEIIVTGNKLPTYEFKLLTREKGIIPHLHSGTNFRVEFGTYQDISHVIEGQIFSILQLNAQAGGAYYLNFTGTLDMNYVSGSQLKHYGKSDTLTALKTAVSTYSNLSVNTKNLKVSPKGRQNWNQGNLVTKRFVDQLIMHTDLRPSFPLVTITSKKELHISSASVIASLPESHPNVFTFSSREGLHNYVYTKIDVEDRLAQMESVIGRGFVSLEHDMETGETYPIQAKVTEKLLNNNPVIFRNLDKTVRNEVYLNDEVMPNYWKAQKHNALNLAYYSRFYIVVTFVGTDIPDIKPTDLVRFMADEKEQQEDAFARSLGGNYFVSRVMRYIHKGVLGTQVFISSDGRAELKPQKYSTPNRYQATRTEPPRANIDLQVAGVVGIVLSAISDSLSEALNCYFSMYLTATGEVRYTLSGCFKNNASNAVTYEADKEKSTNLAKDRAEYIVSIIKGGVEDTAREILSPSTLSKTDISLVSIANITRTLVENHKTILVNGGVSVPLKFKANIPLVKYCSDNIPKFTCNVEIVNPPNPDMQIMLDAITGVIKMEVANVITTPTSELAKCSQ